MGQTWIKSDMPDGLEITDFLSISPEGPLLVACDDGIYISHDSGLTWQSSSSGLPDTIVYRMTMTGNGILYATSWGRGVYRSNDTAKTWFAVNTGFPNSWVFTVYAAQNGYLYAGVWTQGVYRSTDGGANWSLSGASGITINLLYENSAGQIFAGSNWDISGIYRSDDDGDSWSFFSSGLDGATPWSITSLSNGDLVLGSDGDGVFRSSNNGESWQLENLTGMRVEALETGYQDYIFAAVDFFGIQRTDSSLDNWKSVNTGLTAPHGRAMIILSPTILLVGTADNGVFRSDTCLDWDFDWVCNTDDNCPIQFNPEQEDIDGDGFGDLCDDILYIPLTIDFNEPLDSFDRGWSGFDEYFDSRPVYLDQAPGIPFMPALETEPSPHLLSCQSDGPEVLAIDVDSIEIGEVYLIGTGTWLASHLGHNTIWCDNPDHLTFTLSYSDGTSDSLFPIMYSTGLARWGDCLYGTLNGWPGVEAGTFSKGSGSIIANYHLYRLAADSSKQLTRVSLVDKTSDAAGDFGDYSIMAATVRLPDTDADDDGIENSLDNCPSVYNPAQGDIDSDGIGDACDDLSVSWDTINTPLGMGLTLSNHGNAGNRGIGGVNADFVGAGIDCESSDNPLSHVYLYNASPMLMKSANDYSLQIWWNEVTNNHPEYNFRSVFDGVQTAVSSEYGVQKFTSGTFVSSDTTIGVSANWWAAGDNFFVVRHDYYSYGGGSHENVRLGHFYDFDAPNDTSLGVAVNEGGSGGQHPMYVWQRGLDDPAQSPPGCTPGNQRYAVAGMLGYYYDSEELTQPEINHTDLVGCRVIANEDMGRNPGDPSSVFSPDSLWLHLGRSGYYVNNDPGGADQRSLLAYGDFTISTDTLRVYTLVGSIYSGSETDVAALADSAESWYWSNIRGTALADADGDGVQDGLDNCPNTSNKNQFDSDGDGIGDACDSCDPAITVYPSANTTTVPIDVTGLVQFDQPMETHSFDSLTYTIRGEISGTHFGSISAAQTAVSLNPYENFLAGERVTATLTDSIRCGSGESIHPFSWQFVTATGPGAGTYDLSDQYPGHDVEEVCFADLDNDGDPDLVMGSWNFSRLEVRLNHGDGVFDTAVAYDTPGEPASVAAGDLNGDGYMDLVAGYTFLGTDSSISILMNNGDATFAAPVTYLSGPCPPTIQTVDIDGDGDLDLVHGASCNSQDVFILPNNGDGTFGLPVSYPNFAHANSCDIADVNSDGLPDIVTASAISDYVGVFLQNSDGTFQNVVTYPAGDRARTVNTIDLNGDQAVDLVVADRYADSIGILFNTGDGAFQDLVQYVVADEPWAVYAADLDGDGDPDLAVGDNDLTLLINDGTGDFSSGGSLYPGFGGYSITAVDLDTDGDLEIVTTDVPNDTLLIFSRQIAGDVDGDGIPDASDNCPLVYNPGQADLDGDGLGNVCDPDIDADGVDNEFDNCVYVANPGQEDFDLDGLGDACDPDTMNFTPATQDSADYTFVQTADLDRDNNVDIVYTGLSDTGLFVRFGTAIGDLEAPVSYLEVVGAALAIDYVNTDTLLDIVVHTTDSLFVLLNQGDRVFTVEVISPPVFAGAYRQPQSNGLPAVATGYLDTDDYLDIVASPNIVLYGDGAGGSLSNQTISSFHGVVVCDFIKDGTDDLVLIEDDSVKVYDRDVGGQYVQMFSAHIGAPAPDVTPRIVSSDFNLDAISDIATLVTADDVTPAAEVTILFSNGQGDALGSSSIQIPGKAYDLSQADFNKDGAPDLALTNATTADIEIYLGDATGQFEGPFVVDISQETDVPAVLAALDLDRDGNSDIVSGVSGGGDVVIAENDGDDEPVIEHEMFITAFTSATFQVLNPDRLIISREVRTVAGSDYRRFDYNGDGLRDEQSLDYNVKHGIYEIKADLRNGYDAGDQGVDFAIGIDGSQHYAIARDLKLTVKKAASPLDVGSVTFHFPFEEEFSTVPGYGQPSGTLTPTIDWGKNADTAGAVSYQFQLDIHPGFLAPRVDIAGLTAPSYTLTESLGMDSVYYWRYRTERATGWDAWSWEFAVEATAGCCTGMTGNTTDDTEEQVDVSDLSMLVNYLFVTFDSPGCMAECNTDGSANCAIDLSDLTKLVNHLFITFEPLAGCMTACEE